MKLLQIKRPFDKNLLLKLKEIILYSTYFGPKSNPNLSDIDSDPANVLIGPSLSVNRLSRYLVKGLLLITPIPQIKRLICISRIQWTSKSRYKIALKIPKFFNIKLISTQFKKNILCKKGVISPKIRWKLHILTKIRS